MINLDIGGMKNREKKVLAAEWKVLDIHPSSDYVHDLNCDLPFPFQSGEVANIYCGYTLEYVFTVNLARIFGEMHRILAPEGRLRLLNGDVRIGAKWYLDNDHQLRSKRAPQSAVGTVLPPTTLSYFMAFVGTPKKHNPSQTGVVSCFDAETLEYWLKHTGFRDVTQRKFGDCSEIFRGQDLPRYEPYAVCYEAVK